MLYGLELFLGTIWYEEVGRVIGLAFLSAIGIITLLGLLLYYLFFRWEKERLALERKQEEERGLLALVERKNYNSPERQYFRSLGWEYATGVQNTPRKPFNWANVEFVPMVAEPETVVTEPGEQSEAQIPDEVQQKIDLYCAKNQMPFQRTTLQQRLIALDANKLPLSHAYEVVPEPKPMASLINHKIIRFKDALLWAQKHDLLFNFEHTQYLFDHQELIPVKARDKRIIFLGAKIIGLYQPEGLYMLINGTETPYLEWNGVGWFIRKDGFSSFTADDLFPRIKTDTEKTVQSPTSD